MKLVHDVGRSIDLLGADGALRWHHVYGGKPKPYFHPVTTPAGIELTGFQPHGHPWHRGLWFTIKYLNGENFWEEEDAYGTQELVTPPSIAHEAGAVHITARLDWVRPSGETVLREHRAVAYSDHGPDAVVFDWTSRLEAVSDVELDRTPYTTWGGYGGLAFRGSRAWRGTRMLFPGGETSERPEGVPARWCEMSGALDGGIMATGGVAMLDHPGNPRHPTPWYGMARSMNFMNAAFLFHEPMKLAEGAALEIRHRVLVHDGVWEADRVEEEYERWTT